MVIVLIINDVILLIFPISSSIISYIFEIFDLIIFPISFQFLFLSLYTTFSIPIFSDSFSYQHFFNLNQYFLSIFLGRDD